MFGSFNLYIKSGNIPIKIVQMQSRDDFVTFDGIPIGSLIVVTGKPGGIWDTGDGLMKARDVVNDRTDVFIQDNGEIGVIFNRFDIWNFWKFTHCDFLVGKRKIVGVGAFEFRR